MLGTGEMPETRERRANNNEANHGTTRSNAGADRRQRTRRDNRENIRTREGFFMHYLFVTLSVRYAAYFKPTVRRLIEFFTLLKAILMLMLLIYVHITFVKESGHCLDSMKDIWPKEGVLKVQVEANSSLPPYQYFFARSNSEAWASSFELNPYQAVFKYSVNVGKDGLPKFKEKPLITPYNHAEWTLNNIFGVKTEKKSPAIDYSNFGAQKVKKMFQKKFSQIVPKVHMFHPENAEEIPHWVLIDPSVSDTAAEFKMLQMQEVMGFHAGPQPVREYYAIEYSPEFGYLRLSAVTRYKLGIPVLVVTLDPQRDECFGKGLKRWMLDTFFGYDDLIMGSIKRLAEQKHKEGGGYLRNLVTGEHFKFITLWVSQTSYFLAFVVMLIFTLLVTMLLRYSYHQIFVFMVELLHVLDTDAPPVFPAAPMLTIILALVGTEEIMTEFFHDSTLAFYVILSIWIADQFDAICMHTVISRRHWVRFFFFYHFAFYAYHYRYNGQFSELALFTSWLFIQHSMFYFLHHYEIPAIQRQIRLRQILFQNEDIRTFPTSPPRQADPGDDNPPDRGQGAPPRTRQEGENIIEPDTNQEQNANTPPSGENRDNSEQHNTGHPVTSVSLCDVTEPPNPSTRSKLEGEFGVSSDSLNLIKEIGEVHLWEEYPTVIPEESVERSPVGFNKYCHLIMVLFFALSSIILVFSLMILMLNQGKFGARFAGSNFEKLAGFVQ